MDEYRITFASLRAASTSAELIATGSGAAAFMGAANAVSPKRGRALDDGHARVRLFRMVVPCSCVSQCAMFACHCEERSDEAINAPCSKSRHGKLSLWHHRRTYPVRILVIGRCARQRSGSAR